MRLKDKKLSFHGKKPYVLFDFGIDDAKIQQKRDTICGIQINPLPLTWVIIHWPILYVPYLMHDKCSMSDFYPIEHKLISIQRNSVNYFHFS